MDSLTVKETSYGKGLFATRDFASDEIILFFEKKFIDHPTEYSLQVDELMHQVSSDPSALENYVNHSCRPTCYVEFSDLSLRAISEIAAGEELTFDYNSTEWDLHGEIRCFCGEVDCIGVLRGAKYLSTAQRKKITHFSPFILKKFTECMHLDSL